jgi:hypothetical protein
MSIKIAKLGYPQTKVGLYADTREVFHDAAKNSEQCVSRCTC